MVSSPSNAVPRRGDATSAVVATSSGTQGAALDEVSTKTKRSSEAWTIPFHVIMWTTFTVGFIMTLVVLMMRK
jgi:hypothetical protein